MTFEEIKRRQQSLESKRDILRERKRELREEAETLSNRHESLSRLREKTKTVARETQKQLQLSISNLVTLALDSVFSERIGFNVEFVERRNTTECDLCFENDGKKQDALEWGGGAVLDVACFALRTAFWALRKNRPTLIFDEPFRNLRADLQPFASEMIKMLSRKLGIQIIMISHAEGINKDCDRLFEVSMKKGVSSTRTIEETL